jgi:hypothetical protein
MLVKAFKCDCGATSIDVLYDRIGTLFVENADLTSAIREAYEEYAGMEGFVPETAPEGYYLRIIERIAEILAEALKEGGQ